MLPICVRTERVWPKLSSIQGIRANLVYIVSLTSFKSLFCKTNKHKRTLKSITENFCDNMIHTVIVCAIYTKQQVSLFQKNCDGTYYTKYVLLSMYFLSDTIGGIS